MADRKAGLLQRTREFFFPPQVATRAELEAFISGEASYVTQKTVIGYCRVKTLYDYEKLLTEAAFRDGMEICRWEGYAGILGDTLIIVEGLLRPDREPERTRLADSLAALYPRLLAEAKAQHRTDWSDWQEAFARRFALTRQSEPVPPHRVVEDTAKLVHELAPLHPRLKREDQEVILGDLRMHMVAMHAAMLKRFRREALLRELAA